VRAGKAALLSLALLGFLSLFGLEVVAPTLPLYVEHFGVPYTTLGAFFSAYSLTWTLLQLYTGHLADRYGRRRFILLGLLVYWLGALGCGLSQSFPQLFAFRLLQGVGLGLFGPAILGLAAGFEAKGTVFAVYRSAQAVGGVVGPILGGYVARWGLSAPFFASAVAAGLAILPALLLAESEARQENETGFLPALRVALGQPDFVRLCLAAFLAEMGYVSLAIVVPLAGQSHGLSLEVIGLVLAVYYVVFTVTQVPLGMLAERVKRQTLVIISALAAGLAFLGLFWATAGWQMGLAMAVLGVSLGAVFVQSTAWAAEMAPAERKSLYMATFDAVIDFSFVVMPLLVGAVAILGVGVPFLLSAGLLCSATGVFVTVQGRMQGRM
jgi:DHA1 family multidrug resistance protein-like MFS transporter